MEVQILAFGPNVNPLTVSVAQEKDKSHHEIWSNYIKVKSHENVKEILEY